MLLSSLNTGSTDLRDTEVQQPNTTATLSFSMSSFAFSANSGQLEAGSTTTGSSFLPSSPPFLFCSSINISITSLRVVSLIAIVPDSEWRMPTLIVSSARAAVAPSVSAAPASAPAARKNIRFVRDMDDLVECAPSSGAVSRPKGSPGRLATSQRACQLVFQGVSDRRRRIAVRGAEELIRSLRQAAPRRLKPRQPGSRRPAPS